MYVFELNQRVTDGSNYGIITSMVPGNGRNDSEWYFVDWENGTSDRYQRNSIFST
mgnify:CR=1 FL=1